ncbi:MAG: YkgJ family cysteine cluster protein [Planctomycetota bacterium]|jgi:Fe-S-cluster containining protein
MASFESIRFGQEEAARAARTPEELAAGAFARAEALAAESPAKVTWACAAGCTFCCHLYVTVVPPEAEAIAHHLSATLSPTRLADLRGRIGRTARTAESLSVSGYRRARLRCALLGEDDRCLAYEQRPLRCRAHTSTSRRTCERVFHDELPSGAVPLDRWYANALEALRLGMGAGGEHELHAALLAALR